MFDIWGGPVPSEGRGTFHCVLYRSSEVQSGASGRAGVRHCLKKRIKRLPQGPGEFGCPPAT